MKRWCKITGTASLAVAGTLARAQLQQPQQVVTRFGNLTVNLDRILTFRSQPFHPLIQGSNSLDLGQPRRIGATDVVLITDNGGTACPYLYYFVIASQSGAKATPHFGTCNEVILVERKGDSLSLTMHDYRGPFEPEEEKRAAAKRTEVFVFRDGVVSKNGKPVR